MTYSLKATNKPVEAGYKNQQSWWQQSQNNFGMIITFFNSDMNRIDINYSKINKSKIIFK